MPLTTPKAASGLSTRAFSASRLGTIRFSVVLMPDFRTSASASGTAACKSRLRMGILGPGFTRSRRRSAVRHTKVRQPPKQPPSTTLWHARPGSSPAQSDSAAMVTAMEASCSATSTAARVPMRLAAVKYPVMTPHRQVTGRNAANSRRESTVRTSPIQRSASAGAKKKRTADTAALQRMLYKKQPESTQVTFPGRFRPSSSAVRYMAAVRTPAIPATMARFPTDMVSCSSPTPAAPIRPEMYT